MKFLMALLAGVMFVNVNAAHAAGAGSSLFVQTEGGLIDVQALIGDEVEVQAEYGYSSFCYKGNTDVVINKMKAWKKSGFFFSGGGGGFELADLKVNRGIVSYDIVMRLADEVAQGEFRNVTIKSCR